MITGYALEFFELGLLLKENNTKTIYHKLLKLNNPTYIHKHACRHPLENHGYEDVKTINPVILAVSNMLGAFKRKLSQAELQRELETEYAWAFHNYPWFAKLQ